MKRYDDLYPELGQFLGGYFHQDWSYEQRRIGGSFADVVRSFLTTNPATTVMQTIRELTEFLGLELSEEELRDTLLHEFGSYVRAPGLGLTYRQWLEAVLAILQQGAPA
jgi:hypothetical protein